MKVLNIIGDIHGRSGWKDLVMPEAINVFLGDYFDPYDNIPKDDLVSNFEAIIQYKKDNPQTVLLLGNHDYHYLFDGEVYSRYSVQNKETFKSLLTKNLDLFQIAYYNEEHKVLCTHAGVTETWYMAYMHPEDKEILDSPQDIESNINNLFKSNPKAFGFDFNARDFFECYGDDITHGPLWVRPESLLYNNIFNKTKYKVKQAVGHTQFSNIQDVKDISFCDCLGIVNKSKTYEN